MYTRHFEASVFHRVEKKLKGKARKGRSHFHSPLDTNNVIHACNGYRSRGWLMLEKSGGY